VIRVNLLPVREARRKAGARQQAMLLGAGLVGAVLVCGLFHQWVRLQISGSQSRARVLEAQLAQYKPQQEQVEKFKAQKAEIEQKLAVIGQLERSRSGPVHVMDELATRIPDRVWLTHVAARSGQIELKGMSLDNELIALFLTALNGSPYFANVELEEAELREVEKLKLNLFRIRGQLESPDAPAPAVAPQPAPARPGAHGARPAPARPPAARRATKS
jgi:type IV pilus assembly protein PilN